MNNEKINQEFFEGFAVAVNLAILELASRGVEEYSLALYSRLIFNSLGKYYGLSDAQLLETYHKASSHPIARKFIEDFNGRNPESKEELN